MSDFEQKVNPKKLFVGSLPFSASEDQLRTLFSPFGQITELKLIIDRFTGQSKGIAFIEFSSAEEANIAMKALHESTMDGRNIIVNIAKPPRPREDFGYGNNNSRRDDRPQRGNRF